MASSPKNLLPSLTNACNDVAVAEDALVPEFPVPSWLGTLKCLRDSLLVDALKVCHFSNSKENFMSMFSVVHFCINPLVTRVKKSKWVY